MALSDIMSLHDVHFHKDEVTEERLKSQLGNLRSLIAFFREYPDLFVDFIKGDDCKFKFMVYQRQFLRVVMRHRYTYATYPRGYLLAPIN